MFQKEKRDGEFEFQQHMMPGWVKSSEKRQETVQQEVFMVKMPRAACGKRSLVREIEFEDV